MNRWVIALVISVQVACAQTVIRGNHLGENFQDFLVNSGLERDVADCANFLTSLPAMPSVAKFLRRHHKSNLDSIDAVQWTELLSDTDYDVFKHCNELGAHIRESDFVEATPGGEWTFAAGKLTVIQLNFGARDTAGELIGPDVSFNEVVSDFTHKFGSPQLGTESWQNGFGAVFTFRTEMWYRSDAYIVAKEARQEATLWAAKTPTTIVTIVDRSLADAMERKRKDHPSVTER